jgi:hypothetical protein
MLSAGAGKQWLNLWSFRLRVVSWTIYDGFAAETWMLLSKVKQNRRRMAGHMESGFRLRLYLEMAFGIYALYLNALSRDAGKMPFL